jgi:hypothetical protein
MDHVFAFEKISVGVLTDLIMYKTAASSVFVVFVN